MKELLCTSCGFQGKPRLTTKGSIGIEIILWLLFLLPGLIYSVWRHASRYQGCRQCGSDSLIPLNSPVAKKFLADLNKKDPAPVKPPSQEAKPPQKEPPAKKWSGDPPEYDDQPNVYVIK